jgi:hypothetical protein
MRKLRRRRPGPATLTAGLFVAAGLGAAGVIFSDRLAEIWYGRDWTEPSTAWTTLFNDKEPPTAAKPGREPKVENAVLITPSAPPVVQEQPRRHADVRPATETTAPAPASGTPGSTASVGAAPTPRDLPWLPEAEKRAESLQAPPAQPPARVAVAAPEIAPLPTLPTPSPLQPAPAPAVSAPTAATISLPAAEVAELIRRSRGRIELGDIAGARLLLERAASGNEPTALMALAETYDPTMLARWGARGLRADPNKARALYLKAAERGIAEAKARMLALR